MAINNSLLVSAPVLQDVFVDTSGQPMAAGTVTCYKDTSRLTLKNWYYQTGSPGSYTYIALPNPLTLSAAGTICDASGVDTIPFFYPYDEADFSLSETYYITIKNYQETNQITRANFPFSADLDDPAGDSSNAENYIMNNVFWRNCGSMNLSSVTDSAVCPGSHDGFSMPDIRFYKDDTSATDAVTFSTFPLSQTAILLDDPTPEYYLNHTCGLASGSETYKYYQFPISYHLKTLLGVSSTITIQVKNEGGSSSVESTFGVYILQYLGSGSSGSSRISLGNITATPSWEKHEISYQFPGTSGLALSSTGDDAYYLQIQVPLNSVCNINFTKPSLYLVENSSPINNFQSYDQINPIINGPRTGDIRTSLNSFSPYGWVAANDGSIGSAASGATTRANIDTWPLYKLLWDSVSDTYAPVSSGRGASAYDDFIVDKTIGLTKSLGRVIGGAGDAGSGLTARGLGETLGNESKTLSVSEMPAHTHQISVSTRLLSNFSTSNQAIVPAGTGTGGTNLTSDPTGGGVSFSMMQPSVFYNVFFKL